MMSALEITLQTLGVKPLSREGNSQTGDWMPRKDIFQELTENNY